MSTLELRMLVGKARRVTVEGRRAISKVAGSDSCGYGILCLCTCVCSQPQVSSSHLPG